MGHHLICRTTLIMEISLLILYLYLHEKEQMPFQVMAQSQWEQVACLRQTDYYKKEGASYILSLSSQAVVALITEDAMKVAQALGSTL